MAVAGLLTKLENPVLKKLALWTVDHVGPAAGRQARREAAVLARVRAVRLLRRLDPRQRLVRSQREAAIGVLQSATSDIASADPDSGPVTPADIGGRRIAVFIPGFLSGFGGAEKVAGQAASLFAREGASVDLVCIRPPAVVQPYELGDGITLQVLERYGDESRLRHRGYDLMVAFGMPGFYRRIPAIAEGLGVPFVIQECTNPRAMQDALIASQSLETVEEAYWLRQAVLAHAVAARFTTPAYATTVHPDVAPFACGFFNAFARPPGGNRSVRPSRKLICVGSLKNRNKNGLAAARAFAAASEQLSGWSLHFFGENNFAAELAQLKASRPDLAIEDHGVEKDIDRIYADAHALIIPSFEEGLPNVVIEALSYGVPCIGFADCDGVQHLIRDGENGLLASRTGRPDLADAIIRMVDPAIHARLATGAEAFAKVELGIDKWEERWLDLAGMALAGADRAGRRARPPAILDSPRAEAWRRLLATYPLRG